MLTHAAPQLNREKHPADLVMMNPAKSAGWLWVEEGPREEQKEKGEGDGENA